MGFRFRNIFSFLIFFFSFSHTFFGQVNIEISGRVTDIENGTPLVGVNIVLRDKPIAGTITDSRGYFHLKIRDNLPLFLKFSMIGFKPQEFKVERSPLSGIRIRLEDVTYDAEEVIISAPAVEVEQKTLKRLVSVELIDVLGVRETPSVNFYEAIANLKGVDITTQSMQFMTINARGFNSTENIRFVQVVDGMDNQVPGMNFSIGNIAGLSELDVETVEFLPGPSSVTYGSNALNGILVMKSKDPFIFQGLSMYVKPGVSDIEAGSDYPFQFIGKPLFDGAVRYAKSFKDKFAFKINASIMKGEDWYADDTTNIRPGRIRYELDPGYDALNKYGDEIIQELPVGENGTNVIVSRTGYRDMYLVDNNVKSIKLNGALHYRITDKVTAIIHGNYGNATTLYTGDNRIALSGFHIFQGKTELKGDNFLLRGYTTRQNSGNTYDTRFLAIHLNRSIKSDEKWFRDYRNAYTGALFTGGSILLYFLFD